MSFQHQESLNTTRFEHPSHSSNSEKIHGRQTTDPYHFGDSRISDDALLQIRVAKAIQALSYDLLRLVAAFGDVFDL